MTLALLASGPQAGGLLRSRSLPAAWLLICLWLTGCGAEKETLFEEERDLPAHWPGSLADAADKIGQRLGRLGSNTSESKNETEHREIDQCESELRDLVEWIPEVAADTDLTEAQWLPIYEMCEVMREHLSRSDVSALDIEEDFHRLQTLLSESEQLLPSSTVTPDAEKLDIAALDSSKPAGGEVLEAEMSSGDES